MGRASVVAAMGLVGFGMARKALYSTPVITFADIEEARRRIGDNIYLSPCAYSETLSQRVGAKSWLKLENLQMTGSFKERGACNKLLSLSPEERARGRLRERRQPRAGRRLPRGAPRHPRHHRDARGDAAREGRAHARVRR